MLSHGDKQKLLDAGFLPSEVANLNRAKAPDGTPQHTDISTAVWQRTLASRRAWVGRQIEVGKSKQEIRRTIVAYYRRKAGRSPWDFLKVEYAPPKKLTDFQWAMKLRARQRVTAKFGGRYGTPMRRQWRPRDK